MGKNSWKKCNGTAEKSAGGSDSGRTGETWTGTDAAGQRELIQNVSRQIAGEEEKHLYTGQGRGRAENVGKENAKSRAVTRDCPAGRGAVAHRDREF